MSTHYDSRCFGLLSRQRSSLGQGRGLPSLPRRRERFTRKKHDPGFPEHAVAYCLKEAGLKPDQLNYVAFYDKPMRKFERLLETYIAFALSGGLPGKTSAPLLFMDHHESHAASAFFPSPFEEAAILTLDGVGEWTSTAWGVGRGNKIELTHHIQFPHSLGCFTPPPPTTADSK
jgi:carbamoyltransferase